MRSRQLKALRKRQMAAALARIDARIARFDQRATDADDAGLLNEAIHFAGKATFWRDRRVLIADPAYHARLCARRRLAR